MTYRAAAVLALACACGPSSPPSEQPDVRPTPEAPAAVTCTENCQTVDWVDREVNAALADIAVCLPEPTYLAQRLQGNISVHFQNLPCRDAVARVADRAGLAAVLTTVEGQRAVVLRPKSGPDQRLVLLPKGDGWQPDGRGGGASAAPVGPGVKGGACARRCDERLRDCRAACGWNDTACTRVCDERWQECVRACSVR